jgi:phosphodiesterase/alkaline phosphatase D-like protein
MPVKIWLALLSTLATLLAAAPLAHGARGFSLGVQAGDVTARSAILWAKANKSGAYALRVATNRRLTRDLDVHLVRARRSNDNTLQMRVRGLESGQRYFYRFSRGRMRSDVGTFVTAPGRSQNATIEFAWSGDTDFNTQPGERRPHWSTGGIYRRMAAERNDFNINLGDTIYSDSEIPGRRDDLALTVRQKWAKYRTNWANRHFRAVRRSAGLYSHWDDHEFIDDFSPAQNTFTPSFATAPLNMDGRTLYNRSARAFTDYSPVTFSRRNGLYRTVRWGANLELFFLDQRSFRSANADVSGVCDNPQTNSPDFAPTAPQANRAVFAVLYPPFAQPVPPGCVDAIRDPNRTMLGKRQLARFLRGVERSNARFKVIVNEVTIQQYYLNPYDRWEGFEAERQQVLSGLQGVDNVIFLTTDEHAVFANDARFQTLEPGGPRDSGIMDVTVGPVATFTWEGEIDEATGEGNADAADALFLSQPPPDGVGMRCAVIDQLSYGQVRVTRNRLTIMPKDINGRQVQDGGRPCGPFVLNYSR